MAGSIPNNNYENYDYLSTLETGKMTANSSSFDWGGAGLQTAAAMTTILGVGAQLQEIENENQAIKDSMESAAESAAYKQNLQGQQIRDLERITGDKLTASGLEELKAESRLKASAAETGGTMNADVATTTSMNKLHRDAVIRREGEVAIKNANAALVSTRLNLDNQLTMMSSRTQSPLSGFINTMNAGVSGFNTGLMYMNSSQKEKLFNIG